MRSRTRIAGTPACRWHPFSASSSRAGADRRRTDPDHPAGDQSASSELAVRDCAEFKLYPPGSAATHHAGPCREVPEELELRSSRGCHIRPVRSGGLGHGTRCIGPLIHEVRQISDLEHPCPGHGRVDPEAATMVLRGGPKYTQVAREILLGER